MEISKSEFEAILAMATSAQCQVYDKVKPAIAEAITRLEGAILGTAGTAAIAQDTAVALLSSAKRFAALDAFLQVFAQMDLVLTPTGFGVVSNSQTAPASRERVQALKDELLLAQEKEYAQLLALLPQVDGWGNEEVAHRCIRTVCYSITNFFLTFPSVEDSRKWREAQPMIEEADLRLRRLISHRQMETLLSAIRTNTLSTAQLGAVVMMRNIIYQEVHHSPAVRELTRQLLVYIESQEGDFAEYFASDEYKANHYERFQNKQDAAGFHFVG